jgi:hypothetical protein
MAIDNIAISDILAVIVPHSDSIICVDSSMTFSEQSIGTIDTYEWNFGTGAVPATANTAGPHAVYYSSTGLKNITLKVSGPTGQHTQYRMMDVLGLPVAKFALTFTANPGEVSFTDQSDFGLSYTWDFGDGSGSSLQNPDHTYLANGIYVVTLTVTNPCGVHSYFRTVVVQNVNSQILEDPRITFYPNPTEQFIFVDIQTFKYNSFAFYLYDLSGKAVLVRREEVDKNKTVVLDLGEFSRGVYLLRITTEDTQNIVRIVKI